MKLIYITASNFFIYLKDFKELFLEKIIRLTVYLGAFLLPLFFVPYANQFLEYSKIILFYFLVIVGLLLWLIKIFLTKKINWQWQFLDTPLIIYLIVYFFASFFSIDRYSSFIGINLITSASFVTLLFLIIFYFLVSRFIVNPKEIKVIFSCLISAVLLILVTNFWNFLAPNWLPAFGANSVSTFYFLSLLAVILITAFLILVKRKKIKIFLTIINLILLLLLFAIDNQDILLILIFAIFFFILISSLRAQYFSNKLIVSLTFCLFIAVMVLILPINKWTGLISPIEFSLPSQFGWQVSKASLADNFLLGVGPQNFAYSFYKYKPLAFNQTNFWQVGFVNNANFWLEIVTNLGILGLLSLIIILAKYLSGLLVFLKRFEILENVALEKFILAAVSGTVIAAIIIFGVFFRFDFILFYLLFLFLALSSSLIKPVVADNIFTHKQSINLFVYLILIMLVCLLYYGAKIVLADVYASQTQENNYLEEDNFNRAENKLQKAISNNPLWPDYNLKLSGLLINRLLFLSKSEQGAAVQDLLKQILDNLDSASKKENKRADYYYALQQNYTALKNLGLPVAELLRKNNDILLTLDPNNPELYIDRALLKFDNYLSLKNNQSAIADKDLAVQDSLEDVKKDLEKSLTLKSNFVLGYFNLGLYYQELGDEPKALENIAKAYDLDPSQKLVALSLKKLYLNQDKVDKAIEVLIKYLESNPQDIEVRLELATVYKNNNNSDKAKEEIKKILEIEPENTSAKEMLGQLK